MPHPAKANPDSRERGSGTGRKRKRGRTRQAGNRHRAGKRRTRRLLIAIAWAPLLAAALSVAAVLPFRWIAPPTTAFMLQDRSGRIPLMYEWADWPELGSSMALSVIAAEDQRFLDHHGFDLPSIRRALQSHRDGAALRGASTLSQQVAKNLYLWPSRSFLRKGLEAVLTVAIELTWPKKRILEVYLNIAEFGPGLYGVAAASRHYFGREPGALDLREAALLAAVLPNPHRLDAARPSDYLRERQQWILGQAERLQRERWLQRLENAGRSRS